jgi:hypothetical protein
MEIAVIGWGSLIWCPGCLRIRSRWCSDGPKLPIEFARISGDGRLTLVIHAGSPEQPTPEQQTYWALSEYENMKAARKNLKSREGTAFEHIHSLTASGQCLGTVDSEICARIRDWLAAHKNLHAAVWTGLPSNWDKKPVGGEFSVEGAVQYLTELERARDEAKVAYDRAFEYLTNAPSQIQTPVRNIMRKERGWDDAPLARVLFEVAPDEEDL